MIRFLQISGIQFTDEKGNDDGYKLMKYKFLEDIESCRRVRTECYKGVFTNSYTI